MVENQRDRMMLPTPFVGVRWVWMDLDDTLIDFHTNSRAALINLYNAEGLGAYFTSAEEWIEAYESVNKPLWQAYGAGDITVTELRLRRFLTPLLRAGYPEDEAMRRVVRYDTFYLDLLAAEKRVMPGAHDILRLLRTRGYKIGVLSNGFAAVQHRKMDSSGLSALIDEVVLSDDAGVPKPHPDIFRYAMDRVADTTVAHHIMIGDNASTDISGALASGWHAVWYNPDDTSSTPPAGAAVISTLGSLAEILPPLGC